MDGCSGRVDELISGWSIGYARGRAWSFAERLAVAGDGECQSLVDALLD